MLVYNYHPITGEYCGSSPANVDPLESELVGQTVYLVPGYATPVEPPACEEGQSVIWNGVNWVIEDIPVPPPPQPGEYYYLDENDEWVEDVAAREDSEARHTLAECDQKVPRGLEDLIDVLVAKGVIQETDLPQIIRDTISAKELARTKVI